MTTTTKINNIPALLQAVKERIAYANNYRAKYAGSNTHESVYWEGEEQANRDVLRLITELQESYSEIALTDKEIEMFVLAGQYSMHCPINFGIGMKPKLKLLQQFGSSEERKGDDHCAARCPESASGLRQESVSRTTRKSSEKHCKCGHKKEDHHRAGLFVEHYYTYCLKCKCKYFKSSEERKDGKSLSASMAKPDSRKLVNVSHDKRHDSCESTRKSSEDKKEKLWFK